jgi:alpha-tubulin suppressor-like RCC1 family protein
MTAYPIFILRGLEVLKKAGVKIVGVAGGEHHFLFLDSSGSVWNCGDNDYGQLGRDVATGSTSSMNLGKIPDLSNVKAIACGYYHSLFLDSSGSVWSCGYNNYGQLGRDVDNGSAFSVNLGKIPDLSNVENVAGGNLFSFFLDSSGSVWNCGDNIYGQLGRDVDNGSTSSVNLGKIPDLSNVKAIAGGYYHSLFLDSSGNVWSCGDNNYGQLGRDVDNGSASVNLGKIPDLSNVKAIACGYYFSLFLDSSGFVWNCGHNRFGQFGRKVATGSAFSVNLGKIPDLSNVVEIADGAQHSLFLDSSGSVWSCGYNIYGQLGRDVATGSTSSVNLGKIPDLSNVVKMPYGYWSSLFLDSSGSVWNCGGNNYGQLGRDVATGSVSSVNLGKIEFPES